MRRTPLIVGNWKMHTTAAEAIVLATAIKGGVEDIHDVEVVFCPPFPWLVPVAEAIHHRPKHLYLGAQNMYSQEEGAYTGEVSPKMLKPLVKYVILGHSERRHHFGETDDDVNEKVHAALRHDIKPIIAVGEEEPLFDLAKGTVQKTHKSATKILMQVREAVSHIPKTRLPDVAIAYEPVWAIGTGKPATGVYAALVINAIRGELAKLTDHETAEEVRILYGGSVDAESSAEFLLQPEIDGLLVGNASLSSKEFLAIARTAAGAKLSVY